MVYTINFMITLPSVGNNFVNLRWEIEELHRDVKALGLEDSSYWRREVSGLPHDLRYHDQRRQGADGGLLT